MITKHLNSLLFFLILILGNPLVCLQPPQIPSEVMRYLKKNEVDTDLKKQLHDLFSQPDIYQGIARIYTDEHMRNSQTHVNALQKHGFSFFDPSKPHVFTHQNFPDHVFKMGTIGNSPWAEHTEETCINRIRMAEIIRETAKKLNFPITTPTKKAFLPSSIPTRTDVIPQVIVVTTKVNLSNAKKFTKEQFDQCGLLAKELHLDDLRLGYYVEPSLLDHAKSWIGLDISKPKLDIFSNTIGFGRGKDVVILDAEVRSGHPSLHYEKTYKDHANALYRSVGNKMPILTCVGAGFAVYSLYRHQTSKKN
jgi:hypothetical protein